MLKEFQKFILRGNLIDLAIGFTVGASFSTVAKSLVDDMLMPPIGLLMGNADFSNLYLILRNGTPAGPYPSLAVANNAGAVTLKYGAFINNVIALLVVALAMFMLIKTTNRIEEHVPLVGNKQDKGREMLANKKCPYCFTTIAYKATRCSACTSKLG